MYIRSWDIPGQDASLAFGELSPEAMSSVHSARYKRLLKQLKVARQEAGLTQAQVGKALGRHQSFVSKCEGGERRIDAIELERLAALYRKPLTFFLGD